jgi:hypothetical protein
VEIVTSSYRRYSPGDGVPVRITLGKTPPYFSYPHETLRVLAPPPWVFKIEDEEQFRRAYRHHLYRATAERIAQALEEIASRHPGRRLVLLCFEADARECHRSMFASWWEERTGQRVHELRVSNRLDISRDQMPLFGEE